MASSHLHDFVVASIENHLIKVKSKINKLTNSINRMRIIKLLGKRKLIISLEAFGRETCKLIFCLFSQLNQLNVHHIICFEKWIQFVRYTFESIVKKARQPNLNWKFNFPKWKISCDSPTLSAQIIFITRSYFICFGMHNLELDEKIQVHKTDEIYLHKNIK